MDEDTKACGRTNDIVEGRAFDDSCGNGDGDGDNDINNAEGDEGIRIGASD